MELSHSQRLEQKQTLSQSQTQSLHILSLSNCALYDFIQKEQLENPMLEINEGKSTTEDVYGIGSWFSEHEGTGESGGSYGDDEKKYDIPERNIHELKDYLKSQIHYTQYTKQEQEIIYYIIDLLDEDTGYLSSSIKEISYLAKCSLEEAKKCVEAVQSLEPIGIGAEGLSHCLILQVEALGLEEEKLVQMIKYHLVDIGAGHYSKISKMLGITLAKTKEYVKIIRSLNPRPSRGFSQGETEYIVPDIIFVCKNKKWSITLNDKWIGSIGISRMYKNYADSTKDEKVQEYFKEKINRAKFITKCIEQRRDTLMRVATYVMNRQMDFLTGSGSLKTMNLSQVASELGVHDSTISRAVKEKYVETPRGTYALKYFFVGGISDTARSIQKDEDMSREGVKAKIKKLIEQEPQDVPYSDNVLAGLLEKEGIKISRRTVAKYREELSIKNAFERKD